MTKTELQSAIAEATQTDKRTAGVFLDTLSALAYKEVSGFGGKEVVKEFYLGEPKRLVLRRPIAGSHLHSPYKAEAAKYELSIFCAPVLRPECICKRSATIELTFSFSSSRGRQRLCARSTTGCLSSRMASHSEYDIERVGRGREGACGESSGGSDAHRARTVGRSLPLMLLRRMGKVP